jgi:hypothetical protein
MNRFSDDPNALRELERGSVVPGRNVTAAG